MSMNILAIESGARVHGSTPRLHFTAAGSLSLNSGVVQREEKIASFI
jgi:hypothetical protein